jgi:hypothetical protein
MKKHEFRIFQQAEVDYLARLLFPSVESTKAKDLVLQLLRAAYPQGVIVRL